MYKIIKKLYFSVIYKILKVSFYFVCNTINIFNQKNYRRDGSIILFGAWFSNRFADNPRYLYQWLSKNKDSLGLTHVVWVTDNKMVCEELVQKGYEAYLKESRESVYYHRKAFIHFISSSPNDDIISRYSIGALKINLWHGLGGIKGVGFASPQYRNNNPVQCKIREWIMKYVWLRILVALPGGWGNCLYLSTAPYETSILRKYFARHDDCFIESDLPRNCECIELMPSEQKVVDYLSNWDAIIFYLPTFRENLDQYIEPLSDGHIKEFLCKNKILWVEKQHSYSKNDFEVMQGDNV